jgi:hypothetical protein
MLDIWVLGTKERPVGHMLFLPQKVVRHEVWTSDLQRGTITNDDIHGERCSTILT